MKQLIIYILTFSFVFAWGVSDVQGQDQEDKETSYWYVSEYKIPQQKMDSLRTLIDKSDPVYQMAMDEGNVLEYKEFFHHTGGEYNFVRMIKYPSWKAIDEGPGFGEVAEDAMPDSTKRQEIVDGFEWVFEGVAHKDNIYEEVTDVK